MPDEMFLLPSHPKRKGEESRRRRVRGGMLRSISVRPPSPPTFLSATIKGRKATVLLGCPDIGGNEGDDRGLASSL